MNSLSLLRRTLVCLEIVWNVDRRHHRDRRDALKFLHADLPIYIRPMYDGGFTFYWIQVQSELLCTERKDFAAGYSSTDKYRSTKQ
mmetsp:Transcript_40496/g.60021  ORF Transcript_40496/g.60021 Transcript_40496/m.60021 type:complete len:86 (-) Transcript_40496:439-696(-)